MKYSREYILSRAFDVFMEKGYDSTSISVLQRELSMSRGAMYRYFKNKEELFLSVIDEYFFNVFNKLLNGFDNTLGVKETIDLISRRQRIVVASFIRAGFSETTFLNYTALLIQAAKHYPDFIKRFREIHGVIRATWEKVLQNAIDKGEIKKETNIKIIATLFTIASSHETSDDEYERDKFASDVFAQIEAKKETMIYLYNLIKN